MLGRIVSHYKITEKLGGGGMGVVYKAEDTKLHRTVALKFLAPELTRDEEAKKRFIHEAQAASSLDHNNICVVHEIDETGEGQLFICMNYYDGETLKKKIERGSLNVEDALSIALQISSGLRKAHEKEIIHRDIKPANLFITDDGIVKILDFGLAKLSQYSGVTRIGETVGTIAYMSPEQARGEEVDQSTDIWSLGVVLYQMMTGKLPFAGEYDQALIYSILNDVPGSVLSVRSGLSENLVALISRMLEKDKHKRCGLNEVISELQKEVYEENHSNQEKKSIGKMIIPALTVIMISILLGLIYNYSFRESDNGIIKSVAVLPFVDMSPQKDQEYFCDGMTEDLINRLSNVRELKIPARTSMYIFKGKTVDIKDIGKKLSVGTILEGSVQKSGDRLRITAQLINVADGYHLWSERYDRQLKDLFTIQDEISSSIVNTLRLKLSPQETRRLSDHPIDNITAFEYYLKADRLVMRYDKKSLDSAITYLQTALDIMGGNAYLYSGMADVYAQYTNIGIRQEDFLKLSKEYANKALQLKPDLASALCHLGFAAIYDDYPGSLQNAFKYYKRALESNPNEIKALYRIANLYAVIGKPSLADPFIHRAEQQDPLNPHLYIMRGHNYWQDCRFQESLEQYRLLYQADPTSPIAGTTYSSLLAYNGKYDEALSVIDKMRNSDKQNVIFIFSLGLKYALLKDTQKTMRLITPDFLRTCRRDFEWSFWVANALSLAGVKDEALDWLENSVRRGFINYKFMQCDPFLNNIRGEERFGKIMEEAKYEWEHFKVPE